MTKKAEIGKFEYGTKDLLTEEDFKPENTKMRITTFVSGDVLNWLKSEADKRGIGYQTLLDMKLRESMNETQSMHEMVREILKTVKSNRRIIHESEETKAGFGYVARQGSKAPRTTSKRR
jgi:predicted DNA binding CopG/RHH family protein